MKNNINRILVGLFAIAVGVSVVGDVFGLWHNELFGMVWAIALMAASVISIIFTKMGFINMTALCIGFIWFIKKQTFVVLSWGEMCALAFAVLVIALGIYLIFKNFTPKRKREKKHSSDVYDEKDKDFLSDSERFPVYSAVLGESNHLNCIGLTGGFGISFLGKLTVDLTPAVLNSDISFRVFSVFGNTKVYIPMGVRINTNGFSLCGECKNNAPVIEDANIPIIKIKYFNLFGKTDIEMR